MHSYSAKPQESEPSQHVERFARIVGDVRRPRHTLPFNTNLDHLPGDIGRLASLRTPVRWSRRGAEFIDELRQRHGPVFRLQFGPMRVVGVAGAAQVASIIKNEERSWSTALAWRTPFDSIDPTADTIDSLSTLDFDLHKDVRRILQPVFGAEATAGYTAIAVEHFKRAAEVWIAQGEVAFKPTIRDLLSIVSTRIFTGTDDSREADLLNKALADYWSSLTVFVRNPWLSPTWRRAISGHRRLREAFLPKVAQTRAQPTGDLFSRLCLATAELDWLDDPTVVRLFIGIMAGAFDTTSMGLASMAFMLAKHPDWQTRLREEALAVPGDFSVEAARRFEQTEWVWKETLRLLPVTPSVPRIPLRDLEIAGQRIPAGSMVLALQAGAFRDPSHWRDPTIFDPERFSPARSDERNGKQVFLPFGAGAHACIGMHLASMEMKSFWHTVLTRCRFRLAKDAPVRHTLKPLGSAAGDVKLIIERL